MATSIFERSRFARASTSDSSSWRSSTSRLFSSFSRSFTAVSNSAWLSLSRSSICVESKRITGEPAFTRVPSGIMKVRLYDQKSGTDGDWFETAADAPARP